MNNIQRQKDYISEHETHLITGAILCEDWAVQSLSDKIFSIYRMASQENPSFDVKNPLDDKEKKYVEIMKAYTNLHVISENIRSWSTRGYLLSTPELTEYRKKSYIATKKMITDFGGEEFLKDFMLSLAIRLIPHGYMNSLDKFELFVIEDIYNEGFENHKISNNWFRSSSNYHENLLVLSAYYQNKEAFCLLLDKGFPLDKDKGNVLTYSQFDKNHLYNHINSQNDYWWDLDKNFKSSGFDFIPYYLNYTGKDENDLSDYELLNQTFNSKNASYEKILAIHFGQERPKDSFKSKIYDDFHEMLKDRGIKPNQSQTDALLNIALLKDINVFNSPSFSQMKTDDINFHKQVMSKYAEFSLEEKDVSDFEKSIIKYVEKNKNKIQKIFNKNKINIGEIYFKSGIDCINSDIKQHDLDSVNYKIPLFLENYNKFKVDFNFDNFDADEITKQLKLSGDIIESSDQIKNIKKEKDYLNLSFKIDEFLDIKGLGDQKITAELKSKNINKKVRM